MLSDDLGMLDPTSDKVWVRSLKGTAHFVFSDWFCYLTSVLLTGFVPCLFYGLVLLLNLCFTDWFCSLSSVLLTGFVPCPLFYGLVLFLVLCFTDWFCSLSSVLLTGFVPCPLFYGLVLFLVLWVFLRTGFVPHSLWQTVLLKGTLKREEVASPKYKRRK